MPFAKALRAASSGRLAGAGASSHHKLGIPSCWFLSLVIICNVFKRHIAAENAAERAWTGCESKVVYVQTAVGADSWRVVVPAATTS
jgi:hypothetical protein